MNGYCGGIAPGRLPILIGDVDRCPVAMGHEDPSVMEAANFLAGPHSDGLLSKTDAATLPVRWRILQSLAASWRAEWLAMNEAANG